MGVDIRGGALMPGQALGMVMPNKANLWYGSPVTTVGTSNALGNGTLRATPLWVPRPGAVDRIGLEVTAIGDIGSKIRLGIYNDDGTGYPGARLLDAGTIAGDVVAVQEIATAQALVSGLFWLGAVYQDAPTLGPTVRTGVGLAPNVGREAFGATNVAMGYSMTGVAGALPAAFGANVFIAATCARVLVRVTT